MQILFPTFFKTCAEDALSRQKANSASLDERDRLEERSRFENATDSKDGAGFSEQDRLEEQGWLAGNACSNERNQPWQEKAIPTNLFHALARQNAREQTKGKRPTPPPSPFGECA